MDRDRFDALTRLFISSSSRRTVLGALLGAKLSAPLADAAKKRKRREKRRQRNAPAVAAQAVDCLSLGHGANVSGCNYTGEDHSGEDLSSSRMVGTIFRDGTLVGADLSSSAMKNAVFRNAEMCGADLRSSTVGGANFRDADLTLATFKSSGGCSSATFTAGTTFCGTVMCDGSVRNDDCPGGPPPGFCCTNAQCPVGQECQGSACCTTDPVAAIGAAAPGSTVRICAGTYRVVNLNVSKNLTVVGAGAGVTILDAQRAGRVLFVGGGTVEVRDLTITGGKFATNGGAIINAGTLTLIGVTVRDSEAAFFGGGISNSGGATLTLGAGTRIEFNKAAGGSGGGIFNSGSATIAPGAVVTNNTPDNCEPTIGTCS